MSIQMWILARPEMAQFLGGRPAVPYPEPWMDRVDTMKQMQGWTDVSVIHFNDLATFGEQLILSARYGDWSLQGKTAEAAAIRGNGPTAAIVTPDSLNRLFATF